MSQEGWLVKKGKLRGSYKRRFFRLQGTVLGYQENPAGKQKGFIDLSTVVQLRSAVDALKYRKAGHFYPFALELQTMKREWVLIPESNAEKDRWVDIFVGALPSSSIAPDLLSASQSRTSPKKSRRGRESKRSDDDDDEEDNPNPWKRKGRKPVSAMLDSDDDMDDDRGPGTGASSPSASANQKGGFFSRGKSSRGGGDFEMTQTELRETKAKLAKLEAENRVLRRLKDGKKKGKGKYGDLDEPLLEDGDYSDDDEDDEPGCCSRCCASIKKNLSMFVLLLVNFILLVVGCAMAGAGAWAVKNHKHFAAVVPAEGIYIFMATGGALLLLSILGMVGALKRKSWWARCFLYIFAIIMVLVIIIEVAAAALIFKTAGKLSKVKNQEVNIATNEIDRFINDTMYACCDNYPGGNSKDVACKWIPAKLLDPFHCEDFKKFKQGIISYLSSRMKPLAIICASITVVEMLCVWAAIVLAKEGKAWSRKQKKLRKKKGSSRFSSKSSSSKKKKKSRRWSDSD